MTTERALRPARRGGLCSLLVLGSAGLPGDLPRNAFERLDAWDLDQELAGEAPPLVVDVRAAAEAESDPVAGAVSIPLADMPERLAELPEGRKAVLVCNTGYRSAVAAGVAESAGYKVSDLRGGLAAWRGTGAQSCSLST